MKIFIELESPGVERLRSRKQFPVVRFSRSPNPAKLDTNMAPTGRCGHLGLGRIGPAMAFELESMAQLRCFQRPNMELVHLGATSSGRNIGLEVQDCFEKQVITNKFKKIVLRTFLMRPKRKPMRKMLKQLKLLPQSKRKIRNLQLFVKLYRKLLYF